MQNKELSHLLDKQGEQMSIVQADLWIHHKSMAFSMLEGRWVAILQWEYCPLKLNIVVSGERKCNQSYVSVEINMTFLQEVHVSYDIYMNIHQ